MKNLLNYQTSEYDCGPVTVLNGIRYLFEREDIHPDLVKFIMLYCLDTCNELGDPGKHGTSPSAIDFLSRWLNHYGETRNFPLRCEYYSGQSVTITPDSPITRALLAGGVVLIHLYLGVEHYVLLTGIEGDRVLLFDPFYEEQDDPELDEEYSTEEISFITGQPKKANRSVSIERLNRTTGDYYEMGDFSLRLALIMFNTDLPDTAIFYKSVY